MAKSRRSKLPAKPFVHSVKLPAKPFVHSVVDQYRIPSDARVAVIEIEDPAGISAYAEATLMPPPRRAVTGRNEGEREWVAPQRPKLKVIAAVRDDMVAKMYARRQIDRACFMAARDYQGVFEIAQSARIRSVDLSMPVIENSRTDRAQAIDVHRHAADRLRRLDRALLRRFGEDGVELVRDILGRGHTVQQAAHDRGDTTKQPVNWWGGFFRRCLMLRPGA